MMKILLWLGASALMATSSYSAQPLSGSLDLIERFSELNLNVPAELQKEPLEQLLEEVNQYRDQNSGNAEAWIACGLIQSAYGRVLGFGMQGLDSFKIVRTNLEKAIQLERHVLGGYVQAFLGRLYAFAPPWPISFGNEKNARELLEEALEIDADAIANNYYCVLRSVSDPD